MRHILKKVVSYILILAMMLGCLSGCGSVSDTAKKAGQKVSDLGHEVAERASDSAYKAKKAVSELSMPDFKKGFDTAAGFFGATVASLGGQIYVENVGLAISKLETDIANRVSISGSIASNAGNLAEEWHAGTYNIDAVAKGFKAKASTPKSNALGSADVAVGDDVKASLKYLKDANQSASEQAKNYIERYHEYDGPMTMDEWLASNDINIAVDDPDLYWSIYKDQIRIIPSDQLDDAVKCLEKSIAKESAKSGANRQYVAQADIETLQNLTDRIKTSDGVESIPLSKEEAEAIAKAAKEGDFTASEFGITKASSIKSSYVARQAVKAGATSAIIEAALVLGPEIYEIIKYRVCTSSSFHSSLPPSHFCNQVM